MKNDKHDKQNDDMFESLIIFGEVSRVSPAEGVDFSLYSVFKCAFFKGSLNVVLGCTIQVWIPVHTDWKPTRPFRTVALM